MISLVDKSAKTLQVGAVAQDAPEHVLLLGVGKRQMEAGDWYRADRVLTKAHQMCIEDATILANMAWARFHNPKVDEEQRQKEALENLLREHFR